MIPTSPIPRSLSGRIALAGLAILVGVSVGWLKTIAADRAPQATPQKNAVIHDHSASAASPETPLAFVCLSSDDMPDYQYLLEILQQALKGTGYSPSLTTVDHAAGIEALRRGEVAGDCGRTEAFGESMQDTGLIQVKPAFRSARFALWGEGEQPGDPSQLRVGVMATVMPLKELAVNLGYTNTRVYPSLEEMLRAYNRRELDLIGVYEATLSHYHLHHRRPLQPQQQLTSVPVYVFLHPSQKPLETMISAAVQQRINEAPYRPFQHEELPRLTQNTIVMSCSLPPASPLYQRATRYYKRAFEALGYRLKIVALPRARENAELLAGRIDATCGRRQALERVAPGRVVRIDLPVAGVQSELWSRQPGLQFSGLEQLPANTPIAYVRGTIEERALLERLPHLKVSAITDTAIGLKMLSAGRIDFFLGESTSISSAMDNLTLETPLFAVNSLLKTDAFPYLHVRHQSLAPAFTEQLKLVLEDEARSANTY